MKYRKKPVVIEAFKLEPDATTGTPQWFMDATNEGKILFEVNGELGRPAKIISVIITTLEGDMKANVGDYIIQGIKGEIYPCKPDIFEATYEVV